jgi:hypothetical protein
VSRQGVIFALLHRDAGVFWFSFTGTCVPFPANKKGELLKILINFASQLHIGNRQCRVDNAQPGPVVQRIECQIPVLKVVGSNPAGVTKNVAALCSNFFLYKTRLARISGSVARFRCAEDCPFEF